NSFCYVDDLYAGTWRWWTVWKPARVNLGNPAEFTTAELAE
ncbi:MAG: hypothetical protein QOE51_3434, partial [Actinoplanes sp.]|nr:hypothetical protein [Actinoplanes sp.]